MLTLFLYLYHINLIKMNYNSDFRKDLKEGQVIESLFLETLITHLLKRDNTDKKDYKYKWGNGKEGDLYIKFLKENKEVLFEVKDDKKGKNTGNIAIEFLSREKPSGIATTTSDYWVQKYEDSFYIVDVETLKQAIGERKYFNIVEGGDNNTSLLYLFKRDDYLDIVVEGMNKNNLSMIL